VSATLHPLLQRPGLAFASTLLAIALALPAGLAAAQDPGSTPPLPAGSAAIHGTVRGPDGPAAGLSVALYALTAKGHPGIGNAETDASGSFRFENISNDPEIAYLVGARFGGIPFSQRLSFESGQLRVDITIPVSVPIADTSGVVIESSRIRFDWAGSQLAVRETHVLRNDSQNVIYVEAPERSEATRPLVVSTLPEEARGFTRLPAMGGEDLVLQGDGVAYWGPFFPGEQEIDFQYMLPAGTGDLDVTARFPSGTGAVAVAFPETGPDVGGAGLQTGDPVELEGIRYRSLEGGAIARGGSLSLTVTLPEMRQDPGALTLTRSDLFLELDDASLLVNQDIQIDVTPGAPLVAKPGEALLRLELPVGAELIGMSRDSAAIGAGGNGRVVGIAGPLPAGTTRFSYRYAMPVENAGVNLDLRFPVLLETLRVNIADTGDLVVSSNRLHRLRPARSGTRTYLQREAFHVEPNERVSLSRARPRRAPPPRTASIFLLLGVGAAACVFLRRPLRQRGPDGSDAGVDERISRERELVYATIHDLDHDFETGKIAEADYHGMRAELRASAIDLLRRERAPVPEATAVTQILRPAAAPATAGAVPTGAFCPSCGGRIDSAWTFCSHCGGSLAPGASGDAAAQGASVGAAGAASSDD
jgi:hypothetical protein